MEKTEPLIDSLKYRKLVNKSSGVSSLLISDSLQMKRIAEWKTFWTRDRKNELLNLLRQAGKELHFKPDAFDAFANYLNQEFLPVSKDTMADIRTEMLGDYISPSNGRSSVVSVLRVNPENKNAVYKAFESIPDISILDRQYLTNQFVNLINADFTKIALLTSIMVFSVLLLTYGRIELTMVSFIPMFIAWIWILGIMALAGIKFNIINIILSALIFGLGDDYSLFIMDGLLQEYKTGRKNLSSFKSSIILSAITTLAGLGVLIFAKHPALRSIAIISIIGMLCVVFIAQTLIPFLFSLLITNRVSHKKFPWTFFSYSKSIFSYIYFSFGALLLTISGAILIRLNPFDKEKGKLIYHRFLSFYAWSVMYIMGNVKKKVLNPHEEDFSKPCVVICNHSSFLDILLTAMLNPKLILLTNRWVWNSPIFGEVVKLGDYYPVQQGIENSIELLKDRIDHGYSVVVFPEGTRSENGQIKRFHKGAFFLAEKLNLDILPIMIHGSGYGITKGDFLLKDAYITLKFLPRITPQDDYYGDGYTARAKGIGHYFRAEFEKFRIQQEQPRFFREQLLYNFIYKGPVVEWYCRIKLRLERNYLPFHQIVPMQGHILDLGCGYGFMTYMLRFTGRGRVLTAVDYDEEKISVARHCFSWDTGIDFVCSDISTFTMGRYDAIIISDTLHYLPPNEQDMLIRKSIDHLSENGMLIIREGNKEYSRQHRRTALSEFFSTRLTGFNKTGSEGLHFISGSTIEGIAKNNNLTYRVIKDSAITSNMIFILSRSHQLVHNGI
jgi:1-acyl-sn-glycerol-3-phosphate acyltransferase